MKIIKTIGPDKNKKENKIHTLEVSEKELVILAALLGKSMHGGPIAEAMYKSVSDYFPRGFCITGSTNLYPVAEFIKETYED